MDFFEHQDGARRRTRWLVAFFALAVILIIAAVYVAVAGLWLYFARNRMVPEFSLWNPPLFLGVAAVTSSVIGIGSLAKVVSLRSGGGAGVAGLLGGRRVSRSTKDPDERRLLNVVEEMAIASGIPVPEVFVLNGEESINAFAAGFSPDRAVIGVTRGCLGLLDRDELQGVIGHEFSHILNGDMRMNIRLMGIVHGILIIAIIGRIIMSSTRHRSKGGANVALAGLALLAIGYAGVLCGRIIKAAVSRQREFLADASSVQFTRNPGGISGALRKIGGLGRGARLRTPRAEEASHLFFGDALKRGFFQALSTHPPLAERIRRIDPSFTGRFPAVDTAALRRKPEKRPERAKPSAPVPPTAAGLAGAALASRPPLDPARAVSRVGTLDREHIDHASRLLEELGGDLVEAARTVPDAAGVVHALLVSRDEEVRRRQLDILARSMPRERFDPLGPILSRLMAAPVEARLPLMDLAVPSLRRLSGEQFHAFYGTMESLIAADERVDLFELALRHAVMRLVAPLFGGLRVRPRGDLPAAGIASAASVLLSALAHAGQEEDEGGDRTREAFEAGRGEMGPLAGRILRLPRQECGVRRLDRALERLAGAAPQHVRRLVAAATAVVVHDRAVTMEEAEILRAVGHALGCPTPPFIPGVEI